MFKNRNCGFIFFTKSTAQFWVVLLIAWMSTWISDLQRATVDWITRRASEKVFDVVDNCAWFRLHVDEKTDPGLFNSVCAYLMEKTKYPTIATSLNVQIGRAHV